MIFLNHEDILKTMTRLELIDKIEEAFDIIRQGDYYMPNRISVVHKNKNLLFMPCFSGQAIGAKVLSVFPENARIGKPMIHGLMVLNDNESGEISALIDGQALTAERTGAVGGAAIRSLCPRDVENLGIIGAGVQGYTQALYACTVRNIKNIYFYDAYKKDYSDYLCALLQELNREVKIRVCASAEELLNLSQLVITATNAEEPVLPNETRLLAGKTYIALGSYMPDMRELPDALWQLVAQVYTELPFACEESGDLCQPLASGILKRENIYYMGDHLAQHIPSPSISDGKTRCFKSVGVGLVDLICAKAIYTKALDRHIGKQI
ncbi:MAG: ornithine cyclodeaminase family protein [Firmicutes bacterium]|nr:ornithine cyclodeaminase family protein [Bacillota bacterium]